jgi:hypothetical protein
MDMCMCTYILYELQYWSVGFKNECNIILGYSFKFVSYNYIFNVIPQLIKQRCCLISTS